MPEPLEFVTFKWGSAYSARHVNVLRDMLSRHYHAPHRLTCITDNATGIAKDIRILSMWNDSRLVGHCMQRIRLFEPKTAAKIGPRFCWLDLDIVIVDDVTPIFSRTEDFIACGVEKPWQPYNGSMVMMNAGARPRVYSEFSLPMFEARRRKHGYGGGDQGWIACALGPNEARWTEADGIRSYRDHVEGPPNGMGDGSGSLPAGARLVIFNSRRLDPSDVALQERSPWIAEHWGKEGPPRPARKARWVYSRRQKQPVPKISPRRTKDS